MKSRRFGGLIRNNLLSSRRKIRCIRLDEGRIVDDYDRDSRDGRRVVRICIGDAGLGSTNLAICQSAGRTRYGEPPMARAPSRGG
jgi:hypothetical protein